jgi:hypothetical protein
MKLPISRCAVCCELVSWDNNRIIHTKKCKINYLCGFIVDSFAFPLYIHDRLHGCILPAELYPHKEEEFIGWNFNNQKWRSFR